MKADGTASEDSKNWQVHIHGLLGGYSLALDTCAFKIFKEEVLQV